jgi:DNA-binding CsgD family transcriptional regulator
VSTPEGSDGTPSTAGRPSPDEPGGADARPLGTSEGPRLPADSPWWLPILSLWPALTESAYVSVADRFERREPPPSWDAFEAWAVRAGLAEPVPQAHPASLLVRAPWLPLLDEALDVLLESDEVRAELLSSPVGPRPRMITRVARWARRGSRWDVLEGIWLLVSEDPANIPSEVLAVLADLPSEARQDCPILTWASGVAEASLAPAPKRADAMLNRLIMDAALVHADWAHREDTDVAVIAGTLRMVGERRLPAAGQPLESSWRTKTAIDAFIDERSRKGQPPGRLAHSFFRVMSARLALFRTDLGGAADEARWAEILAGSTSISLLAAAVEVLAASLAGEVRQARPDVVEESPDRFRFGGLTQMAAVFHIVARGREALQTLDREGLERAIAAARPDTVAIAGVWAVRVALVAFDEAIWGDPAAGLDRLSAELANRPAGAREQDEPLGGLLLGRARELLLSKLGAFGAAALCSDSLAEQYRAVPRARSRLWAGQLGAAVRIIERALPELELLHSDRLQLLVMRGAATKLGGSLTADVEARTVSAFRELLLARNFLSMATLPRQARDAVFEVCAPLADDPEVRELFAAVKERVGREDVSAMGGAGLFRLTEREKVLLPLLASSESVPDIARRLQVSVHTVRKQVATLREKFQAPTRAELVRKAGRYGALR